MNAVRLATAAMGTRFEIVLVHREGDGADQAELVAIGEAARDEIEEWHRRLSRFAPDSLVSHINRTAARRPVAVDPDTFALLRDALAVNEASEGAFDVTGGSGGLILDGRKRTVRFRTDATRVDLGGIAKGHALDLAGAILREHGVDSALLHGGTSSVVAIGSPPGAEGWRVALGADPDSPTIALKDEALAVSSPSPAGNDGHILDPRSGTRVEGSRRTAVTGPSARLADAWATAAAVLGGVPRGCGAEWRFHFH